MSDVAKSNPNSTAGHLARSVTTSSSSSRSLHKDWLTLGQASEVLGIHYTTLRTWADSGAIAVFRTPGGHRRFSAEDLRRFLEQRVEQTEIMDSGALVDAAVGRVRDQMRQSPDQTHGWIASADEATRDLQRARGRQLFASAIAYVMKPAQRKQILLDGHQLGYAYGREAAASKINLAEAGRAVQFFRNQLVLALQHDQGGEGLDADDVQIQQHVNRFLDEVLYAVLEGYEQT